MSQDEVELSAGVAAAVAAAGLDELLSSSYEQAAASEAAQCASFTPVLPRVRAREQELLREAMSEGIRAPPWSETELPHKIVKEILSPAQQRGGGDSAQADALEGGSMEEACDGHHPHHRHPHSTSSHGGGGGGSGGGGDGSGRSSSNGHHGHHRSNPSSKLSKLAASAMYKSSSDLMVQGDIADAAARSPLANAHGSASHLSRSSAGHGSPKKGSSQKKEGAGGHSIDPEEAQSTEGRGMELIGITGGIIFAFTLNGIELEGVTRRVDKTKHMELSLALMMITTVAYIASAWAGRYVRGEQPAKNVPEKMFMLLAVTTFSSTFCSVYCLKYVMYPTRVLFKSCKAIPVMACGMLLGRKYGWRKRFSVLMIAMGTSVFCLAGVGGKHGNSDHQDSFFGLFLLTVSLCFDGLTGALEDKYMALHQVGPFDMMLRINKYKLWICIGSMLLYWDHELMAQLWATAGGSLLMLGLTGALGQIFIFLSISWFGALTTSVVGTVRKVITMVYSIVHFGHVLNPRQYGGLSIVFAGLVINIVRDSRLERWLVAAYSGSSTCVTDCREAQALRKERAAKGKRTGSRASLAVGKGHELEPMLREESFERRGTASQREYMQALRDEDPAAYRAKVELIMSRLNIKNISRASEKELKDLKNDPTVPFSVFEDAVFRMLTQE